MTDDIVSTILFINQTINHVFNLTVGPTPIQINFEDVLMVGMVFILNYLDHHQKVGHTHLIQGKHAGEHSSGSWRKLAEGWFEI